MAGVPFETLGAVASPQTIAAAREFIAIHTLFKNASAAAQELLGRRDNGLSAEEFHTLRSAVRTATSPKLTSSRHSGFVAYARAANDFASAATRIDKVLTTELDDARAALLNAASGILPRYLIFGATGANELLSESIGDGAHSLSSRNKRARERERHLLLYLQRIAAKNDTFSEFGPSGWGTIDNSVGTLAAKPEPGIATREAFLERWTAHAIAEAINSDVPGTNIQVPALEPHSVEVLLRDVENWPPGAARERWLGTLNELVALPNQLITATAINDRREILGKARLRLQAIGAEPKKGERYLYAATNPIGEECFRECHFQISERLVGEVVVQAEPWIDFWCDTFAFVASRVAETLRQVMEKASAKTGTMPLPDFLRVCSEARLPLTGPGLVAPAVIAFQEVKAAFRQRLQSHAALSEYELTRDDCHVVRNNFNYPKFSEYTYPSADLQLAAPNMEAVERGNYRWILAELHPSVALLHHGGYWSCPDKATLNSALARVTLDKPNLHFGFYAADFTAHTTVRLFDAMPQLANFVAPQRTNPNWKTIPPGQTEVYVDSTSGDVCLRKIDNHEHLGSFARAWVIPLGFHPFQFSITPHTPRLRCGNVVVQRRTWTISLEEFPSGNFNGVSRDLVVAVERLRHDKDLPRHIYIRPTEQTLRRSGAEGRDKDTKPIYVDLESYLFLEIFYHWLKKAGELEITEMLPAPEDLLWHEADGRRTFELRTQIVPRA